MQSEHRKGAFSASFTRSTQIIARDLDIAVARNQTIYYATVRNFFILLVR